MTAAETPMDLCVESSPIDGSRRRRLPLKSGILRGVKDELRKNCLRRFQREREHLIWKIRASRPQTTTEKEIVESAVRSIMSDELSKIENSKASTNKEDRFDIWKYDGPCTAVCGSDTDESEELLLEMQRLLYEDLKQEALERELKAYEEEDAYLARAVFEHMQLNDKQVDAVWCPVCKKGQLLQESNHQIRCSSSCCSMQLDLGHDKVDLSYVRGRLGEAHAEHLERGCLASPKFCLHDSFGLTALYIMCDACSAFDIVV